jgi:hypothetical protein
MKYLKFAGAAAALALTAGMASAASADTYNLNVDGSSGNVLPGSSGTVTVNTVAGGGLDFTVNLFGAGVTGTNTFWSSGGHTSFTFTLSGDVNGVSVSGLSPGFVILTSGLTSGAMTAGSYPDPNIGSFEYAIDCPTCTGADPHPNSLHFVLTPTSGTTQLVLAANGDGVYGAADIRRNGLETGAVGFTLSQTPGVPEPATWAMMILGMGMVGAGMRMRRRFAATAA